MQQHTSLFPLLLFIDPYIIIQMFIKQIDLIGPIILYETYLALALSVGLARDTTLPGLGSFLDMLPKPFA